MLAQSALAKRDSQINAVEDEPAVLDLAHLRRYTLDDLDLQREILGLFRDQVHTSVATLQNCCGDKAAWGMAAHTLKGTARAVGAFRLGRAAERAERNSATPEERVASAARVAEAAKVTLAEFE